MHLIPSAMLKEATITPDDVLKLKAAALYVMDNVPIIDFHKLFKILYFADQYHYANYGRRIIKDMFFSMDAGPVPSNLYDAIKVSRGIKNRDENEFLAPIFDVISVYRIGTKNHFVKGLEKPDMDELSKSDLECINRSIEENRDLDYDTLKKKSHDLAWIDGNAKLTHKVINPLLMAKAAGSSDEMLAYFADVNRIEAILS